MENSNKTKSSTTCQCGNIVCGCKHKGGNGCSNGNCQCQSSPKKSKETSEVS